MAGVAAMLGGLASSLFSNPAVKDTVLSAGSSLLGNVIGGVGKLFGLGGGGGGGGQKKEDNS